MADAPKQSGRDQGGRANWPAVVVQTKRSACVAYYQIGGRWLSENSNHLTRQVKCNSHNSHVAPVGGRLEFNRKLSREERVKMSIDQVADET